MHAWIQNTHRCTHRLNVKNYYFCAVRLQEVFIFLFLYLYSFIRNINYFFNKKKTVKERINYCRCALPWSLHSHLCEHPPYLRWLSWTVSPGSSSWEAGPPCAQCKHSAPRWAISEDVFTELNWMCWIAKRQMLDKQASMPFPRKPKIKLIIMTSCGWSHGTETSGLTCLDEVWAELGQGKGEQTLLEAFIRLDGHLTKLFFPAPLEQA